MDNQDKEQIKGNISIITLHYIHNYGSVLQTYATQTFLEKLGYSVEIIDYVRPNAKEHVIFRDSLKKSIGEKKWRKNMIYRKIYEFVWKKRHKRGQYVFGGFIEKYVHLSKSYKDYEQLQGAPPQAEFYCTGSDQVWNSKYNGGVLDAYFLEFAPLGRKRLAFSASFGCEELSTDEIQLIKKHVDKYTVVSMREKSGVELVQELGFSNVQLILDPTLLINKQEWHMLTNRTCTSKYVLLYQLNYNDEMRRFAKRIAKENNMKVITIPSNYRRWYEHGKKNEIPTVETFLSLFENAEYIVTDSFHGTAFSLNFSKDVFIFYPNQYSTRLVSLLKLTNTTHRVVKCSNEEWQLIPEIDYDYVNKVLNRERKKAEVFVKQYFV